MAKEACGVLRMPGSFVPMTEKEMECLEGGKPQDGKKTAKGASVTFEATFAVPIRRGMSLDSCFEVVRELSREYGCCISDSTGFANFLYESSAQTGDNEINYISISYPIGSLWGNGSGGASRDTVLTPGLNSMYRAIERSLK